jgi:hypothetical protein
MDRGKLRAKEMEEGGERLGLGSELLSCTKASLQQAGGSLDVFEGRCHSAQGRGCES